MNRDRIRLASSASYLPERGAAVEEPKAVDLSGKPWLTTREAAIYLSLPTVHALRRRLERGTVPSWCYTRLGGSLRFSRAALDQLLTGSASDARTMRAITRR